MMRLLETVILIAAIVSSWGFVVENPVRMSCYGAPAFEFPTCTRYVFTVLVRNETLATSVIYGSTNNAENMTVLINGIKAQPVFRAEGSISSGVALQLRKGVNTVEISSINSVLTIDIPSSSPPPLIGAATDFIELEAENATFSGSLIGPNFTFTALASEASSRMAVQLTAPGQWVEFTLPEPTNAFSVRYSIPNSPDGQGWDG